MIGGAADRLRDRDNAAESSNNSAEIGNEWRTGVTLFLEDKFQSGPQLPLL